MDQQFLGSAKKLHRAQHIYNSLRGFCKEVYIVSPYNLDQQTCFKKLRPDKVLNCLRTLSGLILMMPCKRPVIPQDLIHRIQNFSTFDASRYDPYWYKQLDNI